MLHVPKVDTSLMHRCGLYIVYRAIIKCIDLNNMTYKILKAQVILLSWFAIELD